MLRFALLPLFLVQAAPLTLGIVLDQNESITNFDTTKCYRTFSSEIEQAVDWPIRLQDYKRGFSAIKHAKDGTLGMIFGPAQAIVNVSKKPD